MGHLTRRSRPILLTLIAAAAAGVAVAAVPAALRWARRATAPQAAATWSPGDPANRPPAEVVFAAEATLQTSGWFGSASSPGVTTLRLVHPLVGPATAAHPGRPFVVVVVFRGMLWDDVRLAQITAGELEPFGRWNAIVPSTVAVYRQAGTDRYDKRSDAEVEQLYLPDPADAVTPQTRPTSTDDW